MLKVHNITPERRERLFELAIEAIDDLITQTAGMAGGLAGLEGSSKEGVLPFDEAILETCKDFFTRINDLLFMQKAKLEHHELMDAMMAVGAEQTRKAVEKARRISPFSKVAQS